METTVASAEEVIGRLPAAQQGIARGLRGLVRRAAPELAETVKWGHACYVGGSPVCSIVPYPSHVNLAFFRGAELRDPDGLLEGTGKGMRHVKVRTTGRMHRRAVADLVRAAVALD